jgi:hypothetical protein
MLGTVREAKRKDAQETRHLIARIGFKPCEGMGSNNILSNKKERDRNQNNHRTHLTNLWDLIVDTVQH